MHSSMYLPTIFVVETDWFSNEFCLMWNAYPPGRYSGFQVIGMFKRGQKSKPKKIPRDSTKPKKIPGPKLNPPQKIPC